MTDDRSFAVLGPGGVGGFLAAALSRAAIPVVVVARDSTAAVIDERGIDLRSVRLGDFVARPAAVRVLDEPVDVLIVATKSGGLDEALDRVEVRPWLVVPLLNGLDHVAALKDRFGADRVCAGAIRIEADRPEPAVIVQTSPFLRIDLGADDPSVRARLDGLVAVLESAGVPARVLDSEAQVLWSKLVRLNALACTTTVSGEQIGFIRTDPIWRATLTACIDEAAAVAAADGATVDPAATLGELDDAHAGLGSSMQRDIAAGREPELDAIPGAVLRAAARHGLSCPTIASLYDQIAAMLG
jgi:2-dehydropantoate 2-reductase